MSVKVLLNRKTHRVLLGSEVEGIFISCTILTTSSLNSLSSKCYRPTVSNISSGCRGHYIRKPDH